MNFKNCKMILKSNEYFKHFTSLPGPLIKTLDDINKKLPEIGKHRILSKGKGKYQTSFKILKRYHLKSKYPHNFAARSCYNVLSIGSTQPGKVTPMFADIWRELIKIYPDHFISSSNTLLYEPKDYMGWHTNSNMATLRLYINHVNEDNKSFFRYVDPITKENITSFDVKGWQARVFNISKEKPLWHCVYAETSRISLGFRIVKKK